jgi:localization factor PodJL
MVSEASWQTSVGRLADTPSAEGPMDQQSVETLLRRLVERVEESERRYREALDDLHVRLDQLSQTTGAARTTSPEDVETFDRLHDQVSSLARRLEGEASTPLDDFERLGRALARDLDYAASLTSSSSSPDLLDSLAAGNAPVPEPDYSAPFTPAPPGEEDLDKRLVEMAHRLEHSIGTAMPRQALDSLNARLDDIGSQIAKALEAPPKGPSLEPLERQISDMAQQLGQVGGQFAKIGKIETALRKLIEQVETSPSPEEVASKAAQQAARLVADDVKLSAGTVERLDAMHRALMAMNDRTRASDDKLTSTIEAIHDSLKQLVRQIEKTAPQPAAPQPRVPFAERMRDLAPLPEAPAKQSEAELRADKEEMPKTGASGESAAPVAKAAAPEDASPKNRLAAAIADLEDIDPAPHFGRAKRGPLNEKACDLNAPTPPSTAKKPVDAEYDAPDNLVAAARRAAQAAALKAEERSRGSRVRRLPGDSDVSSAAELPSRRKRSFLIISAAVLLAISALLLYGRLRSKPEPEVTAPAAEQTAPALPAPSQGSATPDTGESAPAAVEPKVETTPATPGSSELQPDIEANPTEHGLGDAGQTGNFTNVAKSSYRDASASGPLPQPQAASLKPTEQPALPPGVVFSVKDSNLGAQATTATPMPMPSSLPLPPPDLGPLALRQAATEGDARAQFAIALLVAKLQRSSS